MQHHGVVAGLGHRGHLPLGGQRGEALRPGARRVVHVPIERFRERQALRGLQPQRMHVVDEQQQRSKLLAAPDDAEFRRLLDRVRGVAACVGKPDDLRLGGLCLQQEGREIGRVDRRLDAAEYFAAIGGHHGRGVTLERMTERVVGGQEEPAVAAGLGQRLAGAVGKHIGVIGERDRVRRAGLAGEVGGRGARIEQYLVLFLDEVVDRERDARVRRVGDRIDLVVVDPLPRNVDADIGLVLVVAADDLDLPALLQ